MTYTLLEGNCLDIMPRMKAGSVDTIITDPPYGLSFMGESWDHGVPGVPFWVAALRVAKPGAMLFAFGGTRTQHRLTVAIEDAGWEIRDVIMWVYGSGFPKSLNFGKSMAAQEWKGWGTALKPAWEPIIVAMNPLAGTFAENAQRHGVAGLWIDGGRVSVDPFVDDMLRTTTRGKRQSETWENGSGFRNEKNQVTGVPPAGRWPANLIHDGSPEVVALFPETGKSAGGRVANISQTSSIYGNGNGLGQDLSADSVRGDPGYGDAGSAARFFYCAKASKAERTNGGRVQNGHPTVKPLALMEYLCTLSRTPAGGVVLDPFMGSGSTCIGAMRTKRDFVGIELQHEYIEIARRRIEQEADRKSGEFQLLSDAGVTFDDLPLFAEESPE